MADIVKFFPKYDIPFKHLFKTKKYLIDLLNEILNRKNNNPIVDLQYFDTEIPAESNKNDNNFPLLAITKTEELINIEIQVQNNENMLKRSLYYASKIISQTLPRGEIFKYEEIPNTVLINFMHYNIFDYEDEKGNKEKYHWCFNLCDEETKRSMGYKDLLNIHFIELKKFEKLKIEEKKKESNQWLLFLIDPNNSIFKNGGNSLIVQARNDLITLERDNESYCKDCENEVQRYEEYIHGLNYRENKGRKIGREEGEMKKKIEFVFNCLKEEEDLYKRIELIGMSEAEATIIKNFYGDPNINKLAFELKFDKEKLKYICESLNIDYNENNENNNKKKIKIKK